MSRHILSLSDEQLTAFDLDAFIAHVELFNQHNRETFTAPFPKAPSRWLSHYVAQWCFCDTRVQAFMQFYPSLPWLRWLVVERES